MLSLLWVPWQLSSSSASTFWKGSRGAVVGSGVCELHIMAGLCAPWPQSPAGAVLQGWIINIPCLWHSGVPCCFRQDIWSCVLRAGLGSQLAPLGNGHTLLLVPGNGKKGRQEKGRMGSRKRGNVQQEKVEMGRRRR